MSLIDPQRTCPLEPTILIEINVRVSVAAILRLDPGSGTSPASCKCPMVRVKSSYPVPVKYLGEVHMPLYMYQGAYTSQSWAAQVKNPQNRVETIGRQACEAVGGKLVGAWYSFGEFDFVLVADVPNNESMTAISLAVAAGGAIKSSRTTPLMTGAQTVEAMKKVADVAKVYRPAT
jgi:uncharacterized protein with GYD domain